MRLLLLLITFLFTFVPNSWGSSILKDGEIVVVIHSYSKGSVWTDSIESGVRSTLLNKLEVYQISSEYMDSKRYVENSYLESLQKTYIEKFKGKSIKAIITSDDNAFLFAIKLRAQLKLNIPIIFSGVNGYANYKDTILKSETNITGVVEALPMKENLDLIAKVHPETRKVYFINTIHSPSGKYVKKMFKKVVENNSFPFEVVYLENLKMSEIYKKAESFEENSIALFGAYSRDSKGDYFHFTENMQNLSKFSSQPVYSLFEFFLNSGTVGGVLISGHDHGEIAASKTLDLLRGHNINSVPIEENPPFTTYYDFSVLKKFNMTAEDLPEGVQIINKPFGVDDFYKKFTRLFWTTISAVIFLILAMTLMTIILRNKISFERKIIDLNKTLEVRVENRTQQLIEQQEKLVTTAKLASVGEMASSIAHEINNPLAIIKLLNKKVLKTLGDHKERPSLVKMDETVDRIAKIITSLKAISRKDDANFEFLSLEEVTNEAIHLSESRFKLAGIQISHNLSDTQTFIRGNKVQIALVVLNLLNNAYDAIVDLDEKWVRLEIESEGDQVKLMIRDSGQILDQDLFDKIMDPFFTTKKVGKGTGLGLSISNNIMAHHHGDISIDRSSNKTTFVLSFPDSTVSTH
ncbi:hypothetical protein A9Q84_09855 [Halobacteriovorax marinus]|uniref:histidine kinase n=1 Tax=Halobacteriovorax marinus TaxID=97084 RepID=A0A1Y5FCH3_9BACT|nr:hypothetical protein A9Q84_09855 [Halobacteriovorax marinus]